jgi:hypothetical protein
MSIEMAIRFFGGNKISGAVLFVAMTLARPCLAQSSNGSTAVAFNAGAGCNFAASAVSWNIVTPAVSGAHVDVAIIKKLDRCSVYLHDLLISGKRVPSVVIKVFNGTHAEVLQITLTDAIIASQSPIRSPQEPAENIALRYLKIDILNPASGGMVGLSGLF